MFSRITPGATKKIRAAMDIAAKLNAITVVTIPRYVNILEFKRSMMLS